MARTIITAEHLSYAYKGTIDKALKDISFTIEENECCAIVGPSEAGKTTLCYAIASILPQYFTGGHSEGKLFTNGYDATTSSFEHIIRTVGLLMQNSFAQISGIKPTVFEEVAFTLENHGIEREKMFAKTESILHQLGITHLAQRNPMTLSGGEMQRMALASILVLDPPILILDEPTSALDPQGVQEVAAILKKLKGKKTILLVEHRMELLSAIADAIIVLKEGEMLFKGKYFKAFETPRLIEENIGVPFWTMLYYEWRKTFSKTVDRLPFHYAQTLRKFKEKL